MKRLLITCAAVLFVGVVPSYAGTITLFDGTFNSEDWEIETVGSAYGNAAATQFPLGGSPGAFREVRNHAGDVQLGFQSERTFAWHFNSAQAYEPASGAIESIGYSESSLLVSGGTQVGHVALRQDGLLFRSQVSYTTSSSTTSWEPVELQFLTATDFHVYFNGSFLPTGNPDFSEQGSPIEFGFFRFSSSSQGHDSRTGIDNWRVDIHTAPVPEPSSVAILLLSTGALAVIRRRW